MPIENRSSNTEMVSVPREWLNSVALLQMPLDELQKQAIQHLCEPCDEPAQQHRGEPIMLTAVATLVDDGEGGLEPSWLLEGGTAELFAGMTLLVADNAPGLCSEDGSAQVYTHAVPAEVERLREELDLIKISFDRNFDAAQEAKAERDILRARLAELVSAVRSINYGPAHAVQVPGDDEPCYPQRKEWIEWLLGLCEAASAEPSAPAMHIPEGYCVMPRRLTAENGAKALLLGEFKLKTTHECPECAELEEPTEGCEICDVAGEYGQPHTIPWDQIKSIYNEAVKGLALKQ